MPWLAAAETSTTRSALYGSSTRSVCFRVGKRCTACLRIRMIWGDNTAACLHEKHWLSDMQFPGLLVSLSWCNRCDKPADTIRRGIHTHTCVSSTSCWQHCHLWERCCFPTMPPHNGGDTHTQPCANVKHTNSAPPPQGKGLWWRRFGKNCLHHYLSLYLY